MVNDRKYAAESAIVTVHIEAHLAHDAGVRHCQVRLTVAANICVYPVVGMSWPMV